jgi:hypothetical protein
MLSSPAVNEVKVGADGVVRGTTTDVALEYTPSPAAFTAATLK